LAEHYIFPSQLSFGKEGTQLHKKNNAIPLASNQVYFSSFKVKSKNLSDKKDNDFLAINKFDTWKPKKYSKKYIKTLINNLSKQPKDFLGLKKKNFHILGIVNVSPESFYKAKKENSIVESIEKSISLCEEGASIIDIGGESSKPGSKRIDIDEEQKRVIPVIKELAKEGIIISCDTRNSSTMQKAIDAGAKIINDVSALSDKNSGKIIKENNVGLILMHMKGDPINMQKKPTYKDVNIEILNFLENRINYASSIGISKDKIIIDPGIGFGKTDTHNLKIIKNFGSLHNLGCNILVGASRKSLIGNLTNTHNPDDRLSGSLTVALLAVMNGIQFLRVHDVKETIQALKIWNKLYN